jgi:hypothetical protein
MRHRNDLVRSLDPVAVVHAGGCHCGRVRFEVTAPGGEFLTAYRFNTGTAKHLFCKVCGIKSFYVPRSDPDGFSVNARCLDPGTVTRMEVQPFDGQNWEASIRGKQW